MRCYMARVCVRQAMVFTPCVDGISHNEAEDMEARIWATAGGNVLIPGGAGARRRRGLSGWPR